MIAFMRMIGSVLLVAAVPLGLAAAADPPAAHAGQAVGLGIERLGIEQSGWRLQIVISTEGRIRGRELSPQPRSLGRPGRRHACLRVLQRGDRRLACFGPAHRGGLRMVAARIDRRGVQRGARWTATRNVAQRGGRTLIARVPFRALGLRPGRYRARAVTAWSGRACSVAAADEEASTRVCRSARPRSGLRRMRLRRPVLTGCSPSGPRLVRSGPRSQRRIALTFDDGPGPYTGRVLDILRRHDARATFFVVGSEIAGRAPLLRRMLREGHVVANHTWRHELNAPASSLAATNRRIREATGFTPCSFRPPGGVLSSRLLSDARGLGMTTIMWDVDPSDWRAPGSSTIRARVLSRARPGSIVLLHDGGGNRSQTAAALPGIISTLTSRGYRLVTVPQLLGQRTRWRP